MNSERRTTEKEGTSGPPGPPRSGVRLAAIRQARQVKTARDARLRVRELDVETALGEYYEGVAASEQIMRRADARAREILSAAERASAGPVRAAMAAVRRLKDLGENQTSLVELTGLSAAQVRECLAGTEHSAGTQGTDRPAQVPQAVASMSTSRSGEHR
jgi:hypothetical protein